VETSREHTLRAPIDDSLEKTKKDETKKGLDLCVRSNHSPPDEYEAVPYGMSFE
jgi:hypothetical protein